MSAELDGQEEVVDVGLFWWRGGYADAGRQTRIIWLIYWWEEGEFCCRNVRRECPGLPGDNQSPSFITAAAPPPPFVPSQLSLPDTFGKQPHGKRQNINGLSACGAWL